MLKKERAIVFKETDTQGTLSETLVDDYLLTWLEALLIDRKAQGPVNGESRKKGRHFHL